MIMNCPYGSATCVSDALNLKLWSLSKLKEHQTHHLPYHHHLYLHIARVKNDLANDRMTCSSHPSASMMRPISGANTCHDVDK